MLVVGFKSGIKISNFIYVSRLNCTSNKLGAVAKDDITSVKQQEAMAATIPVNWSLTTLRGVGHLTHYEKPFEVAAAIRADLEDDTEVGDSK